MASYKLIILLATIVLATAKPLPDYDQDGQEVLKGSDTRYYGLPFFWYQRPLTDGDNDYYNSNNGGNNRPVRHRQQHSKVAYETAGSGWGR